MLIEIAISRAVREGRHNPEISDRSHDAVFVWRVSGNHGTSYRFCCRLGLISVYEEPRERHLLTVNVGRLAEIRRRAIQRMEVLKRRLTVIRHLTREEELACWATAARDPETRFFETLKGGPERLGGRAAMLRTLTALIEATGGRVPWPDRPESIGG
jgi:hypothetical protein